MPRPILKALPDPDLDPPLPFAACTSRVLFTPHVHFPSTPALTLTGNTHSPGTYDRAPIVVSPNSCALPERGGRLYRLPTPTTSKAKAKGSYFHPRAYEACETEPAPLTPPLLPDTSETDDTSDECVSPPVTADSEPPVAVRLPTPYHPAIPMHTEAGFTRALSFLPYPSTPARLPEKRRQRRRPRRVGFREVGGEEDGGCLGGF